MKYSSWKNANDSQPHVQVRYRPRCFFLLLAATCIFFCFGCENTGEEKPDSGVFDGKVIDYEDHTGRCLVTADCPPGSYCDLGGCRADCDDETTCDQGEECSPHGRCLATFDEDEDPPLTIEREDSLIVTPEAILMSGDATGATLSIASANGGDFRFRVETGRSYITAEPVWSDDSSGSVEVGIHLDRANMDSGSTGTLLRVISDIGTAVVPISIEHQLGGRYIGEVQLDGDIVKTRFPLMLDIKEEQSEFSARIVSEGSPIFPGGAVGSATVEGDSMMVSVAVMAYRERGGGWRDDFFRRNILRTVNLDLQVSEGRNYIGTYTERIDGIYSEPVFVTGDVSLRRQGGEEIFGSFFATPPPELEPSAFSVPPFSPDCALMLRCEDPEDPSTCTDPLISPSDQEMLDKALEIRQEAVGIHENFIAHHYQENWVELLYEACEAELAGDTPPASGADCLDIRANTCALSLFESYIESGGSDESAYIGTLHALEDIVTAWSFLANDRMVHAFKARLDPAGQLGAETERLDEAFQLYTFGQRQLYEPWRLELLRNYPAGPHIESNYKLFRDTLEMISRSRTALTRKMKLEVRRNPAEKESVRKEVQTATENSYLRIVALGELLSLASEQDPSFSTLSSHLAAGQSVTELSLLFVDLGADRNPVGYSPDYVPFEFRPGGTGLTNFEQILERVRSPNGPVNLASVAENQAWSTTRDWENQEHELEGQLMNLVLSHKSRLAEICGETAGSEPDIENCGENGGQLRLELDNVEFERMGVKLAAQRIENLGDQIRIENDRAQAVFGVREASIKVIYQTGEAMAALTVMDNLLAGLQQFLSIAANAQAWNAGAPVGLGIMSMAIQLQRGLLAAEKDRLHALEKARMETATQEIELINSAATIKTLLLQMETLKIESMMQFIRMTQAMTRANDLMAKVDRLLAERETLENHITESPFNDPAYRVLRDQNAFDAEALFETALSEVYLVARAFEYETNTVFPFVESDLYAIRRAEELMPFLTCMETNFAHFRQVYGSPEEYVDEISVRRDILGITRELIDPVTSEPVSVQEQFRRILLATQNLDGEGGVTLEFATSVLKDNGLFSSLMCNDRIKSIQVMFVGDFLGDNQARISITQSGASMIRSCEAYTEGRGDVIVNYNIDPKTVIVQAGVNDYGTAQPNTGFFGRSVAFANWTLWIPGPEFEPTNEDLDLTHLDDIVLKINHEAISLNEASPQNYVPSCP